jgi:DNA repair exonuclease SbcCD nuclease subunit
MSSILVFSDIHFGEGLNSPLKLDIAIKNVDFIIEQIEKYKISKAIFCGDWFHSRNSISVNTFYKSCEALRRLSEHLDELFLIVGNHDSYYKNSIDVHSLKAFEYFPKVNVINSLTEIQIGHKKILLVPWGNSLSDIQQYKNIDYMFGHFEPNGAELTGSISQGCAYSLEDLTNITPLVFSGHYHIAKEYITPSGKLIMVGSPSQQNWGDIESKRGCYILNTANDQTTFIENSNAPKHIKFLYSEILASKKLPKKELITNNFIKLIVDCPYKYSQITALLEKLQKANPLTLEPEYYYSDEMKLNLLNGTANVTVKDFKTHREYIEDFINNKETELPEDIKRDKLLELALNVYNKVSSEA